MQVGELIGLYGCVCNVYSKLFVYECILMMCVGYVCKYYMSTCVYQEKCLVVE